MKRLFFLKKAREAKKLTQEQVASFLGWSTQTYQAWELGKNEPDIETLKKLSKLLDVSIDYIVDNQRENKKDELISKIENLSKEDIKKIIIKMIESIEELGKL